MIQFLWGILTRAAAGRRLTVAEMDNNLRELDRRTQDLNAAMDSMHQPQLYQGMGAPVDPLGAVGDSYIDAVTGDLYRKEA